MSFKVGYWLATLKYIININYLKDEIVHAIILIIVVYKKKYIYISLNKKLINVMNYLVLVFFNIIIDQTESADDARDKISYRLNILHFVFLIVIMYHNNMISCYFNYNH